VIDMAIGLDRCRKAVLDADAGMKLLMLDNRLVAEIVSDAFDALHLRVAGDDGVAFIHEAARDGFACKLTQPQDESDGFFHVGS
jgi:hypothetical protein